ncbi:MAG TPA: DUF3105 domain-containing protein [Actinotalea sp.]|nr:DUF3105 domain-containing protein [Actinotalea sp.]
MGAPSDPAEANRERMVRLADQHRDAERRRARRIVALSVGVAVVLVVPVVVALLAGPGPRVAEREPIAGVVEFPGTVGRPVEGPVDYPQRPPVGGDHATRWLDCGFSAEPVADEQAVATLARGAVWVTYDPALPLTQVEMLRELTLLHPFLLVSPMTGLPSPVVASAWGVQLRLTDPTDERLGPFLDAYLQGAQAGPPAETCRHG